MDVDQERFFRDELFSLTLMATVQRAGVYKAKVPEHSRRAFQATLRSKLEQVARDYEHEVEEETHIQNIVEFSDSLTQRHKNILNGSRFRLGTAQKALNLYLKYLWCLGKIPRPPHCPFDFRIIAKLSTYKGPKWTDLDHEKDYRNLIAAAKSKAQGIPLAVWELQTYNNIQLRAGGDAPQATHR